MIPPETETFSAARFFGETDPAACGQQTCFPRKFFRIFFAFRQPADRVAGNLIGTDVNGLTAIGNATQGVVIESGAQNNRIGTDADGTSDTAERNVIAGQLGFGVVIRYSGSSFNTVAGNFIGTDIAGTAAIPNNLDGVIIHAGATANTVGGSTPALRNVISGNANNGVSVSNVGTSGNTVAGNYVGTTVTGAQQLGNGRSGIVIGGGADGNTIGGPTSASRNIVADSGLNGIGVNADSNFVQNNFIGTDVTGTLDFGSTIVGIFVGNGASGNLIGGALASEGNLISGNDAGGITVSGAGTDNNTIAGNRIGTDANSSVAIGNVDFGLLIDSNALNNVVGSTTPGRQNVIAGNTAGGVRVADSSTAIFHDNFIGNDEFGSAISGQPQAINALSSVITVEGLQTIDGPTVIASGSTLLGFGTIDGPVTINGTIAPGNSPGIINTGNYTQTATSTLEIEIGGLAPGNSATDHDQVNVTGTVTLDGTLDVSRFNGFQPQLGDSFVIINNDLADAVSGTFTGLAEGSTFTSDTVTWQITYTGGDGNDVVLSALSATFVVVNTNDSGAGSLRQAMLDANTFAGNDAITFDIPGAGPYTISPTSPLPTISEAVTIDATTEPDFAGTPVVEVDGTNAGAGTHGFDVTGSGTVLTGLVINRFDGSGINLTGGGNHTIAGNYIGTDVTGTAALGNNGDGITNTGSTANTIGAASQPIARQYVDTFEDLAPSDPVITRTIGTVAVTMTPDNGHVLTARTYGDGATEAFSTGSGPAQPNQPANPANVSGVRFISTVIPGTQDFAGAEPMEFTFSRPLTSFGFTTLDLLEPGQPAGEFVSVTAYNAFGDVVATQTRTAPLAGAADGHDLDWFVSSAASDITRVVLAGNLTTLTGYGIDDMLVEPAPFTGNIISGNSDRGIDIVSGGNHLIEGNYIGLDVTGSTALANPTGILVRGASSTSAIRSNVISGNTNFGIQIGGPDNTVVGNLIGTDATGTTAVGNNRGITLSGSLAVGNQIGEPGTAGRNVISGNSFGIEVRESPQNTTIQNNFIGTDIAGLVAIPNTSHGVFVINSSTNTLVGTDGDGLNDADEGNLISGNATRGIEINFSADATVVAGNLIGTDLTGQAPLANGLNGIFVGGATNTRIGTNADGLSDANERNVISGNISPGVEFKGSIDSTLAGNYIGLALDGETALGNAGPGVSISLSESGLVIGGTATASRNIIADNSTGIFAQGVDNPFTITGNYIGLAADGLTPVGNSGSGIRIDDSSAVVEGNVISGNSQRGILVRGTPAATTIYGLKSTAAGANSVAPAHLFTFDSDAGNLTDIGPVTISSSNVDVDGLAFSNLGLFAFRWQPAIGSSLVSVNPATAEASSVGALLGGREIRGAAFDNSGRLWAIDSANDELIQVDIATGAVLSNAGLTESGSAFDLPRAADIAFKADGTAWVTAGDSVAISSRFYTLDMLSGELTEIHEDTTNEPSGGAPPGQLGLAFAHAAGRDLLFAFDANTTEDIYTYDTADSFNRNRILVNLLGSFNAGLGDLAAVPYGTKISGNTIGLAADGNTPRGNNWSGVKIDSGASQNIVGGLTPAEGNVISANGANPAPNDASGILIEDSGTNFSTVVGNFIGTDSTGTLDRGNASAGVDILNGPRGTTVGGPTAAHRNIVSGNDNSGVRVRGVSAPTLAERTLIQGNYIGTDVDGTAAVANTVGGGGGAVALGLVSGVIIGTDGDGLNDATEGNLISGNDGNAIRTSSSADSITIAGNLIGTDPTGVLAVPNSDGISANTFSNSVIGTNGDGTSDELERNIISGNAGVGIVFTFASNTNNTIAGNYIGVDLTGTAALGNGSNGIVLQDGVQGTTIGGTTAVERNIIAGNTGAGIFLIDTASTGAGPEDIAIVGNSIGTDATGTVALGQSAGVHISDGGPDVVIGTDGDGTDDALEGNIIAFNSDGVVIEAATGVRVRGNSIYGHSGLPIDLGDDGPTANDAGDGDTGANNLQNFPLITGVEAGHNNQHHRVHRWSRRTVHA